MAELGSACPFEAKVRATMCKPCTGRSDGLPPCVTAWLSSRLGLETPPSIIPLYSEQARAA